MATYRPFGFALAPDQLQQQDEDIWRRGERPVALIDIPVFAMDYEQIELFNWHELAQDMLSEMEFVRQVNVQAETIAKYIADARIKPDLAVPISENRIMRYFKPESVNRYAQEFGWTRITPDNIKGVFMDFVGKMDMSYSYKPVLLLALFEHINELGYAPIDDVTGFFIRFYDDRRACGIVAEKSDSLFARNTISEKEAKSLILRYPFKRFADMSFLSYSPDLSHIVLNKNIRKGLTPDDIIMIREICKQKLTHYFVKLESKDG